MMNGNASRLVSFIIFYLILYDLFSPYNQQPFYQSFFIDQFRIIHNDKLWYFLG